MLTALAAFLLPAGVSAQNYDESKIAPYEMPDALVFNNGKKVRNARQWTKKRRQEVLEVFADQMYGHVPAKPEGLHFKTISEDATVYGGIGTRKIVRAFLDASEQHWFDILVHLPNNADGPVPMFAGINFKGNDATLDERAEHRWAYEDALKAGFGVATAWRDEIEPDNKDNKTAGVRSWYNKGGDWGAISAWAWALIRIMDYIESEPAADASKVAVLGHSRLGKTALWAAANDTRFAIVISNCSGCCGAATSRRVFGENFAIISNTFPHWFCSNFFKYANHEDQFPADQHWLASLAAPRPLYIASASEDLWADPKGEWLTARNTKPVYDLFKVKWALDSAMPENDVPDNDGIVAYHILTGKHDINHTSWKHYIDFATRQFKMAK